MIKKFLLAAVIAAMLLPGEALAWKAKGTVKGDGKPLAGVIVTDGYRFTLTGEDGSFSFEASSRARFIQVVTPSGYVGDFSSGAPQFYISAEPGDDDEYNFELLGFGAGRKDYSIFSVSDPQMSSKKHFQKFSGAPLKDLVHMADSIGSLRPTVGIALGDIAWNRHWVYEDYKQAIARTGIPFYAVIGNHDFIQNRSGVEAGEAYEEEFGPYNYAFFLGDDLVIGLNNIIFKASGLDNPEKSSNRYDEGYSRETLGFVRGLLKMVPEDTHIYIAQHSPIGFTLEYKQKIIKGAPRLLRLLKGHKVDFLSGHTHIMNVLQLSSDVTDHNAAAVGGAWWATDICRDGSPRGYEIITSAPDGDISWAWHNIDLPDSYAVEFIGPGESARYPDAVLANVWYVNPSWSAEYFEDGVPAGPMELVYDISPAYRAEILEVYDGDYGKIPGYKKPCYTKHYFKAVPSPGTRELKVLVKAPDGRSWTHCFSIEEKQ
ncbi:MAG: calcineurin-like phosphoesterase C-terminal domain-containing protein [Bacteroidales bacterium]|nr:calcineurin-like phosphoesterase C-terminal domain-containing protein [Bacteroidales bacterium]